MTEKVFSEMKYSEFDSLMNGYIVRSSQQAGEMPASTFFEILLATLMKRVRETIRLEGQVVDGQLVLSPPRQAVAGIYVHDNQVVLDNKRIVVHLTSAV